LVGVGVGHNEFIVIVTLLGKKLNGPLFAAFVFKAVTKSIAQ
jgi:hypothetical protein